MAQLKGSWDEGLASTVTWISKWRDSARPITSKPGPMLAEEQGILITKEDMISVTISSVLQGSKHTKCTRSSDSLVCDSETLGAPKKLADVGNVKWGLFSFNQLGFLFFWIGFMF